MESEGGTRRKSAAESKSISAMVADINRNAVPRKSLIANPDMSPSPERPRSAMALSIPDRKEVGASQVLKSGGSLKLERPSTAPLRMVPGGKEDIPRQRVFGKLSLFDHEHEILTPKILRDVEDPRHGFPLRGPDDFLRKGEGRSLLGRNRLRELLKQYPVNKEPPFQKSTGGVRLLSFEASRPASANSIFRYLYDNGTIDFVAVRSGEGLQNTILWGRQVRRGMMSWGDRPGEIEVARWLPIFLEGIREYDEPYRFLATMGAEQMVQEAAGQLHLLAADLVPPLRKALDTREPSVVAVAVELMRLILKLDPLVAKTWIYYLPQFSQVFNLFTSKGFAVSRGYNRRQVSVIKELMFEVLILLEEGGGEDATPIVRRYSRVDPAVTGDVVLRRTQKAASKEGHTPWKPFTLF